jgi:aspartate carbamoyltransferase catalytic subunit
MVNHNVMMHGVVWYRRYVHGKPLTWCLSPDSLGFFKVTVYHYRYIAPATDFREEVSLHTLKVCSLRFDQADVIMILKVQSEKFCSRRLVGDFNSRKGAVNETGKTRP